MSSLADQKLLRAAIQDGVFSPVYVFHGEEDFLKDEAVRRLIDAAVDRAVRDFNLEVRRGADMDAETFGSLLATPPMMADRRAIVIRDLFALKKDARVVLDVYLRKPATDTVLVLVAPAGAKVEKQLLDQVVGVEFARLADPHVGQWIVHHVEQILRTTITSDAVALLQDAAGNDLAQLSVELEKLASFCSERPIDDAAVASVVGVYRGETLGSLLDAIGQRNARLALHLLPGVLQQPKISAVNIVMALTTQTLAIAWTRSRLDHGARTGRHDGELFALLKEAGSPYTGRSWGDAVHGWSAAVESWTSAELDRAISALLAADRALKDTRVSNDFQMLTSLFLGLCGDAVPRRAA